MSRGDPGRTARTRGNRSTTTLQPGSRGRAERTRAGAARSRLRDGVGQREPDPACAMRAQRDAAHPASRRASPARRNPPALDSHEPASHNATPDDITKTTPHHPGHAASALLSTAGGVPHHTWRRPYPGCSTRCRRGRPPPRLGGDAVVRAAGAAEGAPCGNHHRVGGLVRQICVYYALFLLLRLFTLHCTRKRGAAEGQEA